MTKKKRYTGRDALMVKLINGATKSGAHKDHKKEEDRLAAREDVDISQLCKVCREEFEDKSVTEGICAACYSEIHHP